MGERGRGAGPGRRGCCSKTVCSPLLPLTPPARSPLSPSRAVFEHFALYLEREVLLELEDVDKDLGLNAAAEALDKLVPTIPPAGVPAARL